MEIQDERVNNILNTLLKYVQGDFSYTVNISGKGDAFDAIAVGLNAMGEELKNRIKELEAVNKELEAFSYTISHDLRAPIRAIIGFSNILREDLADKLDDESFRALDIIKGNATRMNMLVEALLNFSKVGKKELTKYIIDTNALVREALTEVDYSAYPNTKVIFDSLPAMLGDRVLLTQVWINLLSNAFKYSSKAENPVIEIGSLKNERENIYYVKDNGAGFEMQKANKLFGIFHRLHAEKDYPGIGIGLSLVSRVVTKHGGRAWAEGKVNEGAIFYFSLPAI